MADLLSIVASGIAVTQLAGSIVGSVQTLHNTWTSFKGAPKNIGDCLREIEILGAVIQSTRFGAEEVDAVRISLLHCQEVVRGVEDVLHRLEVKEGLGKGKRQWAKVKIVLKEKELSDLVARLERAKSMLGLAVNCYSVSLQQRQVEMVTILLSSRTTSPVLEIEEEVSAIEPETGMAVLPIATTGERTDRARKGVRRPNTTTVMTKRLWIGLSQTKSISYSRIDGQKEETAIEEDFELEWRFFPSAWLTTRGFTWTRSRIFGQWSYSFKPVCVKPNKSRIFVACEEWDWDQVKQLIKARDASVFDTNEQGWTLLHYAACSRQVDLCRWLISQGVRTDAVDLHGRSALHVAAERWRLGGAIDPCDTVATLITYGQIDPMTKDYNHDTLLHSIYLPGAVLDYIIHQDEYLIDLTEKDGLGRSIFAQTAFAPTLENAALTLSSIHDLHNLVTESDDSGATALHHAARILNYATDLKNNEESALYVLSTLLNMGPDLHAINFSGQTPFADLAFRRWHRPGREPSWRFLLWLDMLREAGYDLQEYARTEKFLESKRRYGNYFDYYAYRRMNIEERHEEDAIILHLQTIDRPDEEEREETELKIPGAFPEAPEAVSLDPRCLERGKVSFFIGPMKDGVQEFYEMDWLDHYYWGDK